MRQSPPLAPAAPAAAVCTVLDDFGDLGRAYRETDEAEADAASVIDNLLRGEYSRPSRVVAFNTDEGYARDVSHEIALAVVERARKGNRELSEGARHFLEGTSDQGRIVESVSMIERGKARTPALSSDALAGALDGSGLRTLEPRRRGFVI